MKTFLLQLIKYFIATMFLLYIFFLAFLYIFQSELTFFPPKPYSPHYEKILSDTSLKNYKIRTRDWETLDGWMQIDPNKKKTIIYFGWNGDDTSFFLQKYKFDDANVISFNYRWYGYSSGIPSERVLFDDALYIYDTVITDMNISPDTIFIMWRSLGTGVATYLASQRSSAGVILISPYDSVEKVASSIYWFVPVKFLIKNKFESYKYSQIRENRLLCIYGWMDTVIPSKNTINLIDYWKGQIEKVFVPEANHDNIYWFSETQSAIEEFMR